MDGGRSLQVPLMYLIYYQAALVNIIVSNDAGNQYCAIQYPSIIDIGWPDTRMNYSLHQNLSVKRSDAFMIIADVET